MFPKHINHLRIRKVVVIVSFNSIFSRSLLYDSVFYFVFAFLLLFYQMFISAIISTEYGTIGIIFSTLVLLALILSFWLWGTYLFYGEKGKIRMHLPHWAICSGFLFLVSGLFILILLFAANWCIALLLSYLVENDYSLFFTSVLISFMLLSIFIPLIVSIILFLHAKTMAWFRNENLKYVKYLDVCIFVFSCVSILSLIFTYLPEEVELVLSGLSLVIYFAWQKAYLLSK